MRKPLIFLFAALAVVASGLFVLLGEWQDPKPVASHGVPPEIERRTFVEQSVAVNRSVESASMAAIPSEASPPARFRKDFLASTDLHALYNALLSSKEPGAQMYATAALAECSAFRGHFGSGSDAWVKFNDLVPEGAPDRSERVRLFRLMQDRCRGFTESKLKLALDGLGILFRKPSGDPYAESLATLTKYGLAHDKRVSGETLASAVRFAYASGQVILSGGSGM